MSLGLQRVERAGELPAAWDELTSSVFQHRAFLDHTERHNPCQQRYWWLERGGRPVAGAVVYTLRLDLLTFLRIPSPLRIHFLGVPCSVSSSGLLGNPDDASSLVAQLLGKERGLVVGLNLDSAPAVPGLAVGRTLPTVVVDCRFDSWAAYRRALRSPYRRRLDRTLALWEGVVSERGGCERFDAAMHAQYLEVHRRSEAKLERLGLSFFQQLPADFHLTTHRRDGQLLGWHLAATDGARRAFVLGGLDYTCIAAERTYFNLLAAVLREAIGDGVETLDLGQTAEVPKLRLGGRLAEKGMFGWHSNRALRGLLRVFRGAMHYRRRVPEAHVFARDAAAPPLAGGRS